MRRLAYLVLAFACTGAAHAGDVLYGLDARPGNTTCVAPALPVVATGVTTQPAFPNLSFKTVPEVSNSQFLNGVIDMAQIPGNNNYWYVVERAGRVHRVANDDDATSFTTALDMTDTFAGIRYFEQWGINSIAFHPDFANNGQMYVLYNENEGWNTQYRAVLGRFTSTDGGLTFDPATHEVLLSTGNQYYYHKFGHMAFGPDGFLYASLGTPSTGQNVNNLDGSVLRLDVDGPFPYAIPSGNPFAQGGGRPEIFAWGFRNPWRFSFDSQTGELWLGDVGELNFEEINRVVAGGNYGWNISEGNNCSGAGCASVTAPVYVYSRSEGKAIVGGYVYRGSAIPELIGRYLFGDAVSGMKIWALTYDGSGNVTGKENIVGSQRATGFAEDQNGELMIMDLFESKIYRLLPETTTGSGVPANFPQTLSATGCFEAANPATPTAAMIPYNLNAQLWSDGASKRRWMAIPDGTTIDIDVDGDFIFPPGTVLAKEFSFNNAPVETRLLMRHPNGAWAGYSYEWAADQSDAQLLTTGKTVVLDNDVAWTFPSQAQCTQCHNNGNNFAAGPEIAQLNRRFTYPASGNTANQLTTLDFIDVFTTSLPGVPGNLPALADVQDFSKPVATRARSYLHSNCSICHRPGGTTQSTQDFRFTTDVTAMDACNVVPQHGDLGVSGARLLYPGSPSQSLISLRMNTTATGRMPPVGSALVDGAGTAIVDAWISAATVCDATQDDDGDGVANSADNCTNVANAAQLDTDRDGIGNACDADLNNDCVINPLDLALLREVFFSENANAGDFNGDGIVNSVDLGMMGDAFYMAPGPSALNTSCSNP